MNKSKAKDWAGRKFLLRPCAVRQSEEGSRLPQEDDLWTITGVSDENVTISNDRTGHVWELGLDNVREYRSPNFLLLRCQLTLKGQQVLSDPLIIMSVDRNLTGFEALLKHSWVHEFIGNREVWISEVDNMFQIEIGDRNRDFNEPWTQRFPDRENTFAFPVTLKIQGVEIKQLTFIACDGVRIIVPMPGVVADGGERSFAYDRDSLEFKVGLVIGRFDIYKTLEGVATKAGIMIRGGSGA